MRKRRQQLVVVDGSNLATEGRATPSLKQLDESVSAFRQEHPDMEVVVVVDATFGHRVAPAERDRVKQAELAGAIVTPPAGAVGRGDAFILKIAKRADAAVLSNDSFQEFQAEHSWLFEEGRLIGGKPVARVGWIFTPRNPVRAQNSKARATKAVAKAKAAKALVEPAVKQAPAKRPAKTAAEPLPAKRGPAKASARPKASARKAQSTKAAAQRRGRSAASEAKPRTAPAPAARAPSVKAPAKAGGAKRAPEPVNTARSFQRLLADFKVGGRVEGEVVQFTSHGAMVSVRVGRTMQVVCYAPLAGLRTPPPTRARDVLKKGESYGFTIVAFDATRRRAELALAK